MFAAATLFFDVGVQRDLWPGGVAPRLGKEEAARIVNLFTLARELPIRQGGVVCGHRAGEADHCLTGSDGMVHPAQCAPTLPVATCWDDEESEHDLDRRHAYYVTSGCARRPDDVPRHRQVLEHLVAGVRDVVVFGAGIMHGMDGVVDALLRRRVRVHAALDAMGGVGEADAQRVVAAWKRRMVDGTTVASIARLLRM